MAIALSRTNPDGSKVALRAPDGSAARKDCPTCCGDERPHYLKFNICLGTPLGPCAIPITCNAGVASVYVWSETLCGGGGKVGGGPSSSQFIKGMFGACWFEDASGAKYLPCPTPGNCGEPPDTQPPDGYVWLPDSAKHLVNGPCAPDVGLDGVTEVVRICHEITSLDCVPGGNCNESGCDTYDDIYAYGEPCADCWDAGEPAPALCGGFLFCDDLGSACYSYGPCILLHGDPSISSTQPSFYYNNAVVPPDPLNACCDCCAECYYTPDYSSGGPYEDCGDCGDMDRCCGKRWRVTESGTARYLYSSGEDRATWTATRTYGTDGYDVSTYTLTHQQIYYNDPNSNCTETDSGNTALIDGGCRGGIPYIPGGTLNGTCFVDMTYIQSDLFTTGECNKDFFPDGPTGRHIVWSVSGDGCSTYNFSGSVTFPSFTQQWTYEASRTTTIIQPCTGGCGQFETPGGTGVAPPTFSDITPFPTAGDIFMGLIEQARGGANGMRVPSRKAAA